MELAQRGLAQVGDKDLRNLLSAVFREQIPVPLTIEGLTRVGLQHCATLVLGHLRGLDHPAVQAVLVAVLAERARSAQSGSPGESPGAAG